MSSSVAPVQPALTPAAPAANAKTQTLPGALPWELPLAFFLIAAGSFGLWVSLSADAFRQMSNDDHRVAVGTVTAERGQVRVRRDDMGVWEDLRGKANAAQGDVVFTDGSAEATLDIKGSGQISIGPGSLVVVRVENAPPAQGGLASRLFEKLKQPLSAPVSNRASIEVQKGSVSVKPMSENRGLKISAGGKKFELKSSAPGASVAVEVGGDGGVKFRAEKGQAAIRAEGEKGVHSIKTGREITAPTKPGAWKENAAPPAKIPASLVPVVPQTISPHSGAEISVSSGQKVDVGFRWYELPYGVRTEVEVRPRDVAKGGEVSEGGRAGVSTPLGVGSYEWRVRSRTVDGKYSAWSDYRQLRISDRPITSSPIALKQPPAMKPAAVAPAKPISAPKVAAPVAKAPVAAPKALPKVAPKVEAKVVKPAAPKVVPQLAFGLKPKKVANVVRPKIEASAPVAVKPKSAGAKGLDAPSPNEPENNKQFGLGDRVVITWSRVTGATEYEIEIASDGEFQNLLASQNVAANYRLFRPKSRGAHFWRVRAVSDRGTSAWSHARRFDVNAK